MDALNAHHGVGTARAFSYFGLIPFVAGAMLAWVAGDGVVRNQALSGVAAYGAVILSFIGAIHWGRVIADKGDDQQGAVWLAWGIVPSLLGWTAVLLPAAATFPLLFAGFGLSWAADRRAASAARLPAWYGAMRDRLTVIVCLCLAAIVPLAVQG